jgi:magnesium transporter
MNQPAPTPDAHEASPGLLEVDAAVVDDIAALLASGQRGMVLNLVADLYPADLALLLIHLPFEEAEQLFRWLPVEQAGETLAELDDAFRASLLEGLASPRLTELLDQLDTDDAADVLADLPDEQALRVLPTLEDTEDLAELLDYGEETAGGIMAREYIAVRPTWTLGEVINEVRRQADEIDEVYTAFVVAEDGTLEGVVSLKQLLLSPSKMEVREIMETDFISVPTDVDQEEVARIVQRYDLVSLPVLDSQGQMMGRITIDDVVDVIRDEAEEDMQIMSGVAGGEEPTDSVFRISQGRLPWLVVGLVGAGLSGLVIGSFETALEEAVVLATFIPVVMAMAGNVGIQSAAIAVQGLASGEVWTSDLLRRLGKELSVALINGFALALLLGGFVFSLPKVLIALGYGVAADPNILRLALTAGISLLAVIILSACIGTVVPLMLDRFGVDPAIATGPFITTSNDIIGLAIFFLMASLLYL